MKKIFHHLSGLDRMQEVKPLLAHESRICLDLKFLRAYTVLFICLSILKTGL